jgi:2-iminobutanoate/2-iminopropanoate deaminase
LAEAGNAALEIHLKETEKNMVKTQIHADKAPAAIGPYSQAISCQGFVFVSGQIALNSKTGQAEGNIQEQTRTALTNLGSILEAAGSGLDLVVKTTVFMADMNDFAAMNDVYKDFFAQVPPARSTFQVGRLPRDAKVEIEAIAAVRR